MNSTIVVQEKQAIKIINGHKNWLDARKLVQDKGGLPSNVLHDDILVKFWFIFSEPEREKLKSLYPFWAKEVLIYPEKDKQFKKDTDVVDAFKDNTGKKWVFPASCMPEEAVGRDKVGLFVDPEIVEVNNERVVILAKPKSIVVLNPFIQYNWELGLVDEKTRVPLEVTSEVAKELIDDQKRWLCRIGGTCVRPLVRDAYTHLEKRHVIDATYEPNYTLGVALADLEEAAPKIMVANATDKQDLLLNKLLIKNAGANLDDLRQTGVPEEKLEALTKLIQALEIKD